MIEYLQNNYETILAALTPILIFLIPLLKFMTKNTKLEGLVDKLKTDLNVNQEDMAKILNAANNLKAIGENFAVEIKKLYDEKKDELVANVKVLTDEANRVVENMNRQIIKNSAELNMAIQSFNDFALNVGVPKVKEMIADVQKSSTLPEERSEETDPL